MNQAEINAARDLALTLTNNFDFCQGYRKHITFGARRNYVKEIAESLSASPLTPRNREQIRRYFDALWKLPNAIGNNTYSSYPTTDLFGDGHVTANDVKKSQPQEPTMNANPIEISTKTFVNGQDIANMSDAVIYELIASEEAKIKELQKIETKPKKLLAEIDRRSKGIVDLVAYLDSKAD